MKTQKQRLAAFLFAALVMVAGVMPVLAGSSGVKVVIFIGMLAGVSDNILGPAAAVGAIAALTPAWPFAIGLF